MKLRRSSLRSTVATVVPAQRTNLRLMTMTLKATSRCIRHDENTADDDCSDDATLTEEETVSADEGLVSVKLLFNVTCHDIT